MGNDCPQHRPIPKCQTCGIPLPPPNYIMVGTRYVKQEQEKFCRRCEPCTCEDKDVST